jgi:hypothetical protein
MGCYSTVEVGDSPADKAVSIDWVDPPCAVPGSEAGYIEGTGFGAENVTIRVGGIEAEVIAATGMDASFIVPAEGLSPGDEIEVVVENPGGRLATINWAVCEVECSPPDCDDGNECTVDTCDTSDGTCTNDPVADGTSCDFAAIGDGVCDTGACRERSWGTPERLDGDEGDAIYPHVAAGSAGTLVAIWGGAGPVYARRFAPGVGWGPIETVDPYGGQPFKPQVGIDPCEDVFAVWMRRDGRDIWASRDTDTGWEIPQRLGNGQFQKLGVDPNCGVVAAWSNGPVVASRYTAATGWQTTRIDDGSGFGYELGVGVAQDGSALVVWAYEDPISRIWANSFAAATGWGGAELIDDDGTDSRAPHVAVDGQGNAIAVWGAPGPLRASRYTPIGGWEPAETIDTATDHTLWPRVAFDTSGNAIAVWEHKDSGSPPSTYSIYANRYSPATGWGSPEPIESSETTMRTPRIVIDAHGNGTAVWRARARLWSNRYTPSGGWGEASPLPSVNTNVGDPEIAVDDAGNVTAVWHGNDGTGVPNGVWASRYE